MMINTKSPEFALIRKNLLMKSKQKLLTPKELRVLSLRFGIADGIHHTLQEAGNEFGVTRERIRQIEDNAVKKLLATA